MAVFATEHKDTFLDISRVEGNIFELIDATMGYIVKNIRWSSRLSDDGIHRIEKPEVPIDVLREAVSGMNSIPSFCAKDCAGEPLNP